TRSVEPQSARTRAHPISRLPIRSRLPRLKASRFRSGAAERFATGRPQARYEVKPLEFCQWHEPAWAGKPRARVLRPTQRIVVRVRPEGRVHPRVLDMT